MIKQLIQFAFRNLKYRKLRSYLTMLGIVIGVCALISLITLGQGLENSITSQFDKFGSNILWVGPETGHFGPPSGKSKLSEEDFLFIDKLPKVKYAQGLFREGMLVQYDKEKEFITVMGMSKENFKESFEDTGSLTKEGRLITNKDSDVIIIGSIIADKEFNKKIRINNKLEINEKKFRVLGILEEEGSENDNAIFMSLEDIWDLNNDKDKSVSAFSVTLEKGVDQEEMAKIIERQLERFRGDDDFEVTNPKKVAAQISEILGAVKFVLIGIILISLFVGGLGIMNSMYTSVLERTKDIGVMKSIGATKSMILKMYLIESGVLGLVGGTIGIVLGIIIAKGTEFILKQAGQNLIQIEISFSLILFGLGFSFVVGVISGMVPAIKASRMKPVDALRYE